MQTGSLPCVSQLPSHRSDSQLPAGLPPLEVLAPQPVNARRNRNVDQTVESPSVRVELSVSVSLD